MILIFLSPTPGRRRRHLSCSPVAMATGTELVLKEEEEERMVRMGSYGGMVRLLTVTATTKSEEEEEEKEKEEEEEKGKEEECSYEAAAEEIMLLWGIQQPTLSKPNAFVSQSSLELKLDACGHPLSIFQSPSSLVSLSNL